MQPRPRIRKTIKWGGLTLTVLLVVVWVGSGWWWVHYESRNQRSLGLSGGGVWARWYTPHEPTANEVLINEVLAEFPDPTPIGITRGRTLGSMDWVVHGSSVLGHESLFVPLWPLALGCALATAAAWRLDTLARRARKNLCPTCHYDRTGLASPGGVCPECGSPPPSPRSAA